MHARRLLRSVARLAGPILGALTYCAAVGAHAAGAGRSVGNHPTMLGADSREMWVAPRIAFVNSILDDDCEDEPTQLVQGTPSYVAPVLALNNTRSKAAPTKDGGAQQNPTRYGAAGSGPAVPSNVEKAAPTWEIMPSDRTLNAALARWAASAGWQLVWEIPIDYAVQARTTVPGTFVEAIEAVMKSMATAEIPLKAIFYDGNKVLRIVAKGVE